MKKALTIFALLISGVAGCRNQNEYPKFTGGSDNIEPGIWDSSKAGPAFFMGESTVKAMTQEEYTRFEKGIPEQTLHVNKTGVNAAYDTTYKIHVTPSQVSQGIGLGTVVPLHMFVIAGENTTLNLDFKGDSLVVSGNMKLSESGKLFIDFCRKYMKNKIDSLETELQKCNEIKGKANFVTRMGNSSIYDYTTPIVSTDPLISDVEPIGITNIDFLTFQMLLDYEKECTKDTLRIIKLVGEYASFFVVNGDLVGAVRYEKELSDKGYHYIYNHYEFYDPASKSSKCYYYFVKEATLKGFIQWYKEKAI